MAILYPDENITLAMLARWRRFPDDRHTPLLYLATTDVSQFAHKNQVHSYIQFLIDVPSLSEINLCIFFPL